MSNRLSLALRMGDNALILAQQNSKWCGHAPTLEEDIAMANVALDLFGQARLWFDLAGQLEGKGRDEDQLAFLRNADEFRNAYLVEQPNGDYAQTLARQFLFDQWHDVRIARLTESGDQPVREIATKARNEVRYHLRRSRELVTKLAKGSDESHKRIRTAITKLWPSFLSLFEDAACDAELARTGVSERPSSLKMNVLTNIASDLGGVIDLPTNDYYHRGAVEGVHSENLGHILAEMQILQRSYPGLEW